MKTRGSLLFLVILLSTHVTLNGQSEEVDWINSVRYKFSLDGLLQRGGINQGATFQVWHFVKEKIGIGPSLSYRNYDSVLDETMINVGIEAIFLTGHQEHPIRTFGAFQSGIGFPILNNGGVRGNSVTSSRLYLQPQVGLLIDTRRLSNVSIAFGFIHQGLDYIVETNTSGLNLTYNRYVLSVGLML